MSLLDLRLAWGGLTARRTKRAPISQLQGMEAEQLEPRALLSAMADLGVDTAPATIAAPSQKASVSFPNLVGTWNLTGTGTTVLTGNVVVTSAGEDDLNATFNITGLPLISAKVERSNAKVHTDITVAGQSEDVHLKGKYNKNHDTITLKGKVDVEGQGKVKVNLVINFNSNTNPTTFTLSATSSNGGLVTLQGTRVVEI